LATTDDARVHCAVLKIREVPARSAYWRRAPVLAEVPGRRLTAPCGRSLRTQQRARSVRLPDPRSVPHVFAHV